MLRFLRFYIKDFILPLFSLCAEFLEITFSAFKIAFLISCLLATMILLRRSYFCHLKILSVKPFSSSHSTALIMFTFYFFKVIVRVCFLSPVFSCFSVMVSVELPHAYLTQDL